MSKKTHTTTIRMPDTIDAWTRRIHINVRGEKVTMVYRWKSRKDDRDHTQRMTLEDHQVANLQMALGRAAAKAIGKDDERRKAYLAAIFAGSALAE